MDNQLTKREHIAVRFMEQMLGNGKITVTLTNGQMVDTAVWQTDALLAELKRKEDRVITRYKDDATP